jgi:hypothetical protein
MGINVYAHYFPTENLDLLNRFGSSQVGTVGPRCSIHENMQA